MRGSICLLLIFFQLAGCASAAAIKPISVPAKENSVEVYQDVEVITPSSKRLPKHEKLYYNVAWLGVSVGELIVSINGIQNINGRDAYILEGIAKSKGLVSAIHKIDSRVISYFDCETLLPLRQEIHRHEAGYHREAIIDFNQKDGKAVRRDLVTGKIIEYKIPNHTQDILSTFYYFMLVPLKIGDRIKYNVLKEGLVYHFMGLVESRARIKLPVLGADGKEAFLLYPYAEMKRGKLYKGHTSLYYSCDERSLPLFMISKALKFGQMIISLVKIDKEEE
jgi:hypothetical protein